jgi:hypothetical protein
VQVTAVCFVLPCAALGATLLARNRQELRVVGAKAAAVGARRGAALARRALGAAWDDATALPGLVLYATGTQLADAAGAGPRARRLARALAADALALPEAIAVAALDACRGVADALRAHSRPQALVRLARDALRDAAAFPAALAEAFGATPLAELLLDVVTFGSGIGGGIGIGGKQPAPPPGLRFATHEKLSAFAEAGGGRLLGGSSDGDGASAAGADAPRARDA